MSGPPCSHPVKGTGLEPDAWVQILALLLTDSVMGGCYLPSLLLFPCLQSGDSNRTCFRDVMRVS